MSGEIIIGSVDDLHRVVREHGDANYFYRGESSASFVLRPKYGRFQSENAKNDISIEQALLNEFKRRAAPLVPYLPTNDWEWLAIAQHFGMITRLLDWTENPLVAAFFDCRRHLGVDRVIYAIDVDELSYADESISPLEVDGAVVYRPKHIAARITAQGGLFTVHG